MSLFNKSNELAVLSVGRVQEFTTQQSFTGAPQTDFSGVDVKNAVKSTLAITLRENPNFLTAVINIDYVTGAEYTLTFNITSGDNAGTYNIFVTGEFFESITLGLLQDAINSEPGLKEVVTATVEPGRGLVVTGNPGIAFSVTGSANVFITSDITETQTFYLWAFISGIGWAQYRTGEVTTRGFFGVFDCAPFDRLYVEIEQAFAVKIGKGVLE